MASLEEILKFIRTTDANNWNVISHEISRTRERGDEEVARSLSIGGIVRFQMPDQQGWCKGRIEKIKHRAVFKLLYRAGGLFNQISVPAGVLGRLP